METFPVWICEEIVAGYRERGLASLFRWQAEVLSDASLRAPHYANLLFSAPTSAGKTVVAELIAVNTVLTTKRKALFIFPYVSVAREKFIALQKLWRSVNLRVRAYVGACSAPLDCWDAAVCTIEKANSLLNRATEEGTLEDIGVVVVDEFHMIFDSNRGQIIEHMVAKLLYASAYLSHHVQIIAMSATISNLAEIADWLKAHQFETHFRPVELEEGILIGKTICDVQTLLPLRSISSRFELPADPERIIQLCMESLSLGDSVLIFCSSKAETEKVATMVSNHLRELLSEEPQQDFNHMLKIDALSFFVEYFQNETQSSDEILLTTIPTGVAFHHAGLTMEEREAVEDGFRAGVLRILVATSTLSSGVNLPAQRVIIKAQLSGPSALTNIAYRQMVGRAGRLGQSSKGKPPYNPIEKNVAHKNVESYRVNEVACWLMGLCSVVNTTIHNAAQRWPFEIAN
ncbi:DNA polymerase theta [Toxocara canis]|uniref:DNA polymerase theta n=1 Tax=Toxocara canis TaxID=6265 RepID=A0A0B2VZY4_TOXCA|nr:DNA polymerase theta [Toxocara canis]